jgi:hypothetical protein
MGQNGGARPGAGRPRLEATKLREAIIKVAQDNAERLAEVLKDKALTGDVPALREIMDRGLGKAHQTMDVTSDNERIANVDPRMEALARKYDEEAKKILTD